MLYDQMKGFVVLGLLDTGGCALVAQLVLDVLASSPTIADEVFQHDVLVECLQKLVTKNVDDIRQQAAVKMLHDAGTIDAGCAKSVRHCVRTLRSLCDTQTFNASLFVVALDIGT